MNEQNSPTQTARPRLQKVVVNGEQQLVCWCCCFTYEQRAPDADPWQGRLDGYCDDCATARCDAYPDECPADAARRARHT